MKARRSLLAAAVAFITGSFRARSQQKSTTQVRVLAKHPLTGNLAGLEATVVEVTIPPGPGSPAHRHPGFILGFVLEGEMQFGIAGSDVQHIKQGQTFFEPLDAVHTRSASGRPDAPVKIIAFSVAKQGSEITLPA